MINIQNLDPLLSSLLNIYYLQMPINEPGQKHWNTHGHVKSYSDVFSILDSLHNESGPDGVIFVHPHIQVLERNSSELQGRIEAHLNISQELSASLMSVSASGRGLFAQRWLIDSLTSFHPGPVLCTNPDLLFEPSLEIDPLALFRQAAKIIRLILLWPGEYSANTLSYAIPEHHHFRTWKISESLLRQPVIRIVQISDS